MAPPLLLLIHEEDEIIEPSIEIVVVQLPGGAAAHPEPKPVYPSISIAVKCCLLAALVVPGLASWNGHGLPRIPISMATAQHYCERKKNAAHYEPS
jgi:hypothetical protein